MEVTSKTIHKVHCIGRQPSNNLLQYQYYYCTVNNSQWYKIAINGTLQKLSTNTSNRVRSDGSQLRISSAINKDNGTYCCKALMQMLDVCNKSAKATLIVVMPPVIVAGQNRTVFVGNNMTIECIIENVGTPSFVIFR